MRAAVGLRGLVLLTVAALVLRLVAAFATGAWEPPPGRWEHGYEVGAVAVSLAEGRGFSDPFLSETGPTAAVGPALPFVWSLLIRAFGPYSAGAWAGMVLLNVLFSTLVVPAAWALGRRCGGEATGTLAAAVWALHPIGVLGPTTYQSASGLYALFVTLGLERLVALEQADRAGEPLRPRALSFGLVIGLSLWVEPLWLPVLAAWLAVTLLRRRFSLLRHGLLACLVAAALAAPWAVRNLVVFHEPVFLRSWAGPELLLGAIAGPGEPTPIGRHPSRSSEEMRELRRLGEPAYASAKAREAAARIAERPGRWLAACAWRWAVFWTGRLDWWLPAPGHPVAGGWGSRLRGLVHLLPALLAAAGLLRARRFRPAATRVLAIAFAAYPVTYALTHVEARYRHPLEAAVTVAAVLLVTRGGMLSGRRGEEPQP